MRHSGSRKPFKASPNPLALAVLALFAGASTAAVAAADEQKYVEADPIVVTATRTAHTIQEASSSIDTISEQEIEVRAPVNFEELFTDIPNVSVQDLGFMSNSISVRGSDPKTTTYLIDGVRQDFTSNGGNMPTGIFIDPEMLKFVEVKHGGGSSLYGNGGIGGTIAVTTKSAADFLQGTDRNYGTTVKAGFSSDTLEWHESVFGYGRGEAWDAVLGVSRRDSSDVRSSEDGKRSDSNRDGDFTSVLAKATLFTGENSQVGVIYNYDEQNFEAGRRIRDVYQYKQHRLTGTWNYEDNKLVNLKTAVQYVHSDFDYTTGIIANTKFDSLSGNVQNTSYLTAWGSHALTYGGDLSHTKQSGEDNSLGQMQSTGMRPDSEGYDAGLFIQDEYAVNDYVTAIPVLRWNHYKRESNAGLGSINDSKLTPGFTLRISPTQNFAFWGAVSTGYRPPILDELYTKISYPDPNTGNVTSIIVDPNPDLKPEKSTDWEFGLSAEGRSLFSEADQTRGKITVFYSDVADFINIDGSSFYMDDKGNMHYRLTNTDKVIKKGVEFTGAYENGPFNIHATYGYLHLEDDETGEKISGVTPQSAKLRTSWKFAGQNVEVWHRAFWAAGGTGADDKEYGGYVTHAVGVLWEPKLSGFADFTVGASIENLFNKTYQTLGTSASTYPGTGYGRGVRVWVSGRF